MNEKLPIDPDLLPPVQHQENWGPYTRASMEKRRDLLAIYLANIQQAGDKALQRGTEGYRVACMAIRHAFCNSRALPPAIARAAFVLPHSIMGCTDHDADTVVVHGETFNENGLGFYQSAIPGHGLEPHPVHGLMFSNAVARVLRAGTEAGWLPGFTAQFKTPPEPQPEEPSRILLPGQVPPAPPIIGG